MIGENEMSKNTPVVRVVDTHTFIIKAKATHGDRYDYSKSDYKGGQTNIEIVCREHGSFWQTPENHYRSIAKCPKCPSEDMLKRRDKSKKKFIEKSRESHGDKYDYSKVEFVSINDKVVIICPKHGEFEQIPSSHRNGHGCEFCSREDRKSTTKEFVEKANIQHGERYDYSKVIYESSRAKVIISCPHHGDFRQEPAGHLRGYGCPKCVGSNGENMMRDLLENTIFPDKKFPTIRPEFLKNPETGWPLELDCYNDEMKLAFEFQGSQHYRPIKRYGGQKRFEQQQKQDQLKRELCAEKKIVLIEIDARELGRTRNKNKIKQKILQILLDKLDQAGYIVSNNGGLNGK
jgi:hypothetical protein